VPEGGLILYHLPLAPEGKGKIPAGGGPGEMAVKKGCGRKSKRTSEPKKRKAPQKEGRLRRIDASDQGTRAVLVGKGGP